MSKKRITLVKADEPAVKPAADSKQKDTNGQLYFDPEISYAALQSAMQNSFVLGWIIKKLGRFASLGFKPINKNESLTDKEQAVKNLLDQFDQEFIFRNMFWFGDCYYEFSRAINIKYSKVYKILNKNIRLKYRAGEFVYEQMETSQVEFTKEEIFHFKQLSITNKYFGDSIFAECVAQVTLLKKIDDFFKSMFKRWMLKSKIFQDVEAKLDEDETKVFEALMKDQMKWEDNSFATALIPCKLEQLDLQDDINVDGLLNLRTALIKAITIALDIPYDVVMTDNSNRSTIEIAKELVAPIITSVQNRFIQQLKEQMIEKGYDPEVVGRIELIAIDTSNPLDDMKVNTGYKSAGVMTANEVRKWLGLEPITGGDEISASQPVDPQLTQDVMKIMDTWYDETAISNLQKKYVWQV